MPLTRSRENLLNLDQPANVSFTVDMSSENTTDRVQEVGNPSTPVAQGTRSKGRSNTRSRNIQETNYGDIPQIRQLISESFNSFRQEMQGFVSNELQTMFQNMTVGNTTSSIPNNNRDSDHSDVNNAYSDSNIASHYNGGNSQNPFYAEKVLNIIRNWHIKFSGHDSSILVEEFIYRVNILTTKTLGGNFKILDDHAHCLFEGKALAWFWRYHRTHDDIDWITLTNALRNEYKSNYTNYDVLEDIRRRKQRSNETFDEYFEAISELTDRLKTPLSDGELCETMLRNIKHEIRHELLHLDIRSVSQLRKEVQKHEKFMRNIHAMENRKLTKARIAEVSRQEETDDELNVDNEVCAVQSNLKCWNCDKLGHSYIDCMEQRKIFCYGCGAKDIYKPTCPNCSRKHQGNGQRDVRRK